MKILLGFLTVR